ncbi:MAG: T9SS type A sorting domain-containing protein [Bacteroidota bacterium]
MSYLICVQHRKLPQITLSLLILLVTSQPLKSQVELIAQPDRGTTRKNSVASVFYEFEGKVFFNTVDQTGYALYCTDGTPAGTVCVTRDITPMAFTSCGDWLYVYGSKPQYAGTYNIPWGKFAIWRMKADGTERQKLVDLYRPYSMYFQEVFLWSSQERVYYSWRGGLSWIDNNSGVVSEYYQGLQDTSSYREDYYLEKMAQAGNGLFFTGFGTSEENFFFTDLISHSTVSLATIKTSESWYSSGNLLIFNNKCYVLLISDSSSLWESDGTGNGTRIVWQNKTNLPEGNPFFPAFIEFQGKLIFDVPESEGDSAWHSIYTFDGSSVQLLQKHPENRLNLSFVESPDALFVFVTTKDNEGIIEAWKLDSSGYRRFGTVNCRATYGAHGCWQDNLIILRTLDSLLVLDDRTLECMYSTGIHALTFHQTARGIFFNQYDEGYVRDPYVLQTSPPSCTLLRKMVWSYEYGTIDELFPLGNQLFFRANSDSTGRELWTTAGNPQSTHLVKEINTATGNNAIRGTNPTAFVECGNRLLFTATGLSPDYMDKQDFTGLWMTDGSDEGTVKLEDLMIDEETPDHTKVIFKDRIWFAAKNKVYGDSWKLWVSDGSPGEARIFEKDSQGRYFEWPYGLTVSGNLLYFFAYTDLGAVKLWSTDGSEEGTRCIDDLIGDQNNSYSLYNVPQIRAAGGRLYFTRDRLTEGSGSYHLKNREVWVTDGTTSGTHCLADYKDSYSKDLYIRFLGIHQGNLVFTYATPQDGFELWYSEGERLTTRRLTGYSDTRSNPDKYFSGIVSLGEQFFFTGFTEENGYELWVSDGTPDGTAIFMELAHGQQSTWPHDLTLVGDRLVFFCSGDGLSDRLWVTDGTLEGTEPMTWNDNQLSNIHEVHFWQHALFFVASHPATGDGLYRYELPGTLGIEPIVAKAAMQDIRIYPNPAAGFIHIELEGDLRFPMTLRLINSSGRMVKEFSVRNKQSVLSVSDLPADLYLIQHGKLRQSFIKK